MQEVVFNTKKDADKLQKRDYKTLLSRIDDPLAKKQTTAWAEPRERLDGKWAYPILDGADYTDYVVEDYDANNYANDE